MPQKYATTQNITWNVCQILGMPYFGQTFRKLFGLRSGLSRDGIPDNEPEVVYGKVSKWRTELFLQLVSPKTLLLLELLEIVFFAKDQVNFALDIDLAFN